MIRANVRGGRGKTLGCLIAATFAFAAAQSVWADEVIDLNGQTISSSNFGDYKDKVIENGTINLSAKPSAASEGTYTIGANAIVNCSCSGGPEFSGNWGFNIVNGGTYNQKGTDHRFLFPFLYGNSTFTLDNGTFTTEDESRSNNAEALNFGVIWINNANARDKNISAKVVIKNGSTLSLSNGALRIGGARSSGSYKPKTLKVDFAVTNSTISLAKKQIVIGSSNTGWLSDKGNSYVKAVFGPGADITAGQIYIDGAELSSSVTFDGATIHWNGNNSSFIGHTTAVGDMYEIQAGGLTVDIPSDKALTCDSNASSLKGEGGITKIGEGAITWNKVSSKGSQGMTFTGPLVVSNGTWTSSLSYAASSFAVDGANSTLALSGAFTASAPDVSATQGGTLDFGSGEATTRALGTLTLEEGTVLRLTGGAMGVDEISAGSLVLSATSANPVALDFTDAGNLSSGTYNVLAITGGGTFAEGDEAKFALDANAPEGSALSVSGATLVLTVPATNPATWTGGANDGLFSSAGNWLGNAVPGAGDDVVISVASETTLTCDVALNVNSMIFPVSSAKVTISGAGSITTATTITNYAADRPVVAVPVEFVADNAYAPIDVTGEVEFAGGVKGTLPASHTKFYGNYTLTAASWTLSSAITIAENATVTATDMEMHPNGKLLNAETGSKLKLKQLTFDKSINGNVFGTYKGELDVGTFYTYYPNGTFTFNSGFTGLFRVGYFHNYTAGVRNDVNFTPASSATIVIGGKGFDSQTGWLKLGSLVARSSGNWEIQLTRNNYTYSDVSQSVEINSGSFDVDTSDYDDPSAAGHTVNVVNNETKFAASADYLLKGNGAMSAFGKGTLKFSSSANFKGGFTASNGVTVAVNKGVYPGKGNVTFRDAATFHLVQSGSGTVPVTGTLTMAAGTTLRIPTLADGILPLSVGALAFDGVTAEGKVALNIEGGALVEGYNAIIQSASALPENAWDKFAVTLNATVPEGMDPLYITQGNTLYIVLKGENDFFWTGGGEAANFSNPANWMGGQMPSPGSCVYIAAAGDTTLVCDIPNFSPASITFPDGSEAITIAGTEAITGIVAVTNLSTTTSHTINVPVHFAGDIQVKQAAMAEVGDLAKAHVTFSGGAYAAEGYALENDNLAAVYSRCIFGDYYLYPPAGSPWTAQYQGSQNRICLAPGSVLHVPTADSLTELYIDNGGIVTAGVVTVTADTSIGHRLCYRNFGELVITEELTASGTGGKKDMYAGYSAGTGASNVFKIEKATCTRNDGWTFYFAEGYGASHGTYYFGKGGINFGSGKGYFGIGKNSDNDAQTIRPWYGDFAIEAGSGNSDGFDIYFFRSVTFNTDDENGVGRTITLNARPRFNNTPTFTVSGSGKVLVNSVASNTVQPPVTVTGTATLALKPGASLGTGATAVNSGAALEVAESGTVALGGDLTLKANATLRFNFTSRVNAPVLDLTGKTVTFAAGATTNVVVGLSSDVMRPFGGTHVLTAGGKFADATVSLADGAPKWVKGVSVVDGDIVLNVKPSGTRFSVR